MSDEFQYLLTKEISETSAQFSRFAERKQFLVMSMLGQFQRAVNDAPDLLFRNDRFDAMPCHEGFSRTVDKICELTLMTFMELATKEYAIPTRPSAVSLYNKLTSADKCHILLQDDAWLVVQVNAAKLLAGTIEDFIRMVKADQRQSRKEFYGGA